VLIRFVSKAQREQLSGFPAEIDDEALDRFFMISGASLAEACQRRGDENRLGWSLRLCGLRMLGFCSDDMTMRFMQNPNYSQSGVSKGSLSRKLATRRMK
jgi:uncharacterized protein DUF4158